MFIRHTYATNPDIASFCSFLKIKFMVFALDSPIPASIRSCGCRLSVVLFYSGMLCNPMPQVQMHCQYCQYCGIVGWSRFDKLWHLAFLFQFVRYQQMAGLGVVINKNLRVFLDGQDAGSLILTHIYLLVGCSAPLWLSSPTHLSGNDKIITGG